MESNESVLIKIDNEDVHVATGRHAVAALKSEGKVPLAHELDQLIDGKLVPLADDGSVEIRGDECFSSQPRKGHSS